MRKSGTMIRMLAEKIFRPSPQQKLDESAHKLELLKHNKAQNAEALNKAETELAELKKLYNAGISGKD